MERRRKRGQETVRLLRGLSLRYRIAAGVILGVVVLLSAFGFLAVRAIG